VCGFAGIVSPRDRQPIAPQSVRAMTSVMAHRGPDDEAFHSEPGVALGFRRLSIIDLAGGSQPLSNEDGSIWLVFNGEIYNHEILRNELVAHGHRFRSRCDSEVIVHAYEQWGHRCASRLRGIFAFAIWDRNTRALWLVRDHSGIKPLYLTRVAGQIRFASEIKALMVDPEVRREIDPLGYVGPGVIDPDFEPTPFVGIAQIGAARALRIDADGERVERYWHYAPSCALDTADGPSLVEEVRLTIDEVIKMQLMADVPVGAYLSGGIDSSAVVAAAIQHGASGIHTFTSADPASDDALFANQLAENWRIPCTFVDVAPRTGISELIRTVAWMAEGEFDGGYLARYMLAHAARADGIKVILTGQGIDEILTGYSPDFNSYLTTCRAKAMWGGRVPTYRGFPPFGERLTESWAQTSGGLNHDARLVADALVADHGSLSRGLLRFEDRMGMANGVEVRVPLLDHRLLELLAAIPHSSRAIWLSNKRILREAVRPWLPEAVVDRPKHRFNSSMVPLSRLVLVNGDDHLRSLLSRSDIARRGYFDPDHCEALLAANHFFAMDHVFIIQLLDEMFVSRFPTDPAAFITPRYEVRSGTDRKLGCELCELSLSDVVQLNPNVFGASVTTQLDLEHLTLPPPRIAEVLFSQVRAPVPVSPSCLTLLAEIDGKRSGEDIYVRLNGQVSRDDLLSELTRLLREGVIRVEEAREPRGGTQPSLV
jgi:asparagine synthase (glutamine-hydrolysing)